MLESAKSLIMFKSVDKNIRESNYDLALEKLNTLIQKGYNPKQTFLKRGKLCHKLLMYEEAYSDFTYLITHYTSIDEAYRERMYLSFDMANYYQAIYDAEVLLKLFPDEFEYKNIKLLSYILMSEYGKAKEYILELFDDDKYKAIGFLFNETAKKTSEDDLAKALKFLDLIEFIDPMNPLKAFNEANIYKIAGQEEKSEELLKSIDSLFPKYFVSHFKFTDMYEDRNLLEISFLLELKIFDKTGVFSYPMAILEGYKNQMEGHIIDSRECFEKAIEINPDKPEAYVLLGQTLQLMSGYDNPEYMKDAENNYRIAMELYKRDNLTGKVESMKRQIKHLNSSLGMI